MAHIVTEARDGWLMTVSLEEGKAFYINEGFAGCISQDLKIGTTFVYMDDAVLNSPHDLTTEPIFVEQAEPDTDGRQELDRAILFVEAGLLDRLDLPVRPMERDLEESECLEGLCSSCEFCRYAFYTPGSAGKTSVGAARAELYRLHGAEHPNCFGSLSFV